MSSEFSNFEQAIERDSGMQTNFNLSIHAPPSIVINNDGPASGKQKNPYSLQNVPENIQKYVDKNKKNEMYYKMRSKNLEVKVNDLRMIIESEK